MLQSAHHAPLLPALVGQLLGTDRPPAPRLSEKRRTRMEKMLVLLLEHGNLRRSRFALLLEVSESTAYDDAAALLRCWAMGWCRRGSSSAAPHNRAGMA